MSARKPYVRPMAGWWRRDPFFVEYMLHEGTAFFVLAYALQLLLGVVCLAIGEVAWNTYLSLAGSVPVLLLDFVILLMMLYHTYSWFKIMPRTLPAVSIAGKSLRPAQVTVLGLLAALFGSAVLLFVVCDLAQGLS